MKRRLLMAFAFATMMTASFSTFADIIFKDSFGQWWSCSYQTAIGEHTTELVCVPLDYESPIED